MEDVIILEKVQESAEQVIANDSFLLIHDLYEPTISHRLALYMTNKFPEYDVDCEYNRNIDDPSSDKILHILHHRAIELGIDISESKKGDIVNQKVIPDIVVHKRGRNGLDNNLVVIEVKKTSSHENFDWDREKLKLFTSSNNNNNFIYNIGLFVVFTVKRNLNYKFEIYKGGRKVE